MKNYVLLVFFFLGLCSCDIFQSTIDQAKSEIEYAEKNIEVMTTEDWSELEIKMQEFEIEFEQNRDKYSDEQIKEIGNLKGRYAALLFKKGMNDIKDSIKDVGDQLEGFIEGIQDNLDN